MPRKQAIDITISLFVGCAALLFIALVTYFILSRTGMHLAFQKDASPVWETAVEDEPTLGEIVPVEYASVRGTVSGLSQGEFILLPEYAENEAQPGTFRVQYTEATRFSLVDTRRINSPQRAPEDIEEEIGSNQLQDGDIVVVYSGGMIASDAESISAAKVVLLQ